MSGRSAASALLVVLASWLAPGGAAADTGIVVESYTRTRPDDAAALIGPVLDELTTRGFSVGYDGVGRKFEAEVSRPGRTPGGLPAAFAAGVERGHQAWIKGRFEEAVQILVPLIEAAHGNPAVVSQDQDVREAVQRGLIDLALSHQRLGDPPAARETIGELLRSFPDAVISRATHGPEAFELYDSTRKALAAAGTGTLSIEVVDATTVVFVDEHYERVGSVRKPDLIPGRYRVYASAGQRVGRLYEVVVRPGAETRLTIDGGFDAVLHVAPSWTGFAFPTDDDRERLETTYAAKFGRMAHANAVAVVGLDVVRGRLAVVGSLVSLHTGRELRRASVAVEPQPSTARLHALASYIAGDDAAKGSIDIEPIGPGARFDDDVLPRAGRRSQQRWGAWRFVTAGAGLAAAGVGAYLLILDGDCKDPVQPPTPCPDVYESSVAGWALVGGGAALVGAGIYMFATNRTEQPPLVIVPRRRGAVATVTLRF